jgi:hypothetical protein
VLNTCSENNIPEYENKRFSHKTKDLCLDLIEIKTITVTCVTKKKTKPINRYRIDGL